MTISEQKVVSQESEISRFANYRYELCIDRNVFNLLVYIRKAFLQDIPRCYDAF